jgi:hypothetical protein
MNLGFFTMLKESLIEEDPNLGTEFVNFIYATEKVVYISMAALDQRHDKLREWIIGSNTMAIGMSVFLTDALDKLDKAYNIYKLRTLES